MERSAHHLPSRPCPRIYDHHFAPSSASTAQPTSAHGTFRGPFIWRRLRNDPWGRCVGVFLGWSRGPLHEPYGTTMYRNPPARMVRSAVLLFGDVCGMIVGVDALGFFGMVTRTASRTLRNHSVSKNTLRGWKDNAILFIASKTVVERRRKPSLVFRTAGSSAN